MKKGALIALIVALSLFVAGVAIALGGALIGSGAFALTRFGWSVNDDDWAKLDSVLSKFHINIGTGGVYTGNHRDIKSEASDDGTYSASGFDNVEIDWLAGNITLTNVKGDSAAFSEVEKGASGATGSVPAPENALRYEVKNNTLYIQYCESGVHTGLETKDLDIALPEELSNVTVYSSAGKVDVSAFSAGSLDVHSDFGAVTVTDTAAGNADISASSGDITMDGAYGSLSVNCDFGRIELFEIACGKADISSSSGDVSIGGEYGALTVTADFGRVDVDADFDSLELDAASGDVNVVTVNEDAIISLDVDFGALDLLGKFKTLECSADCGKVDITADVVPRSISVEADLGSVEISLPKDVGITLEAEVDMGSFKSDFAMMMNGDTYIVGNGECRIEADLSMGDLKISER